MIKVTRQNHLYSTDENEYLIIDTRVTLIGIPLFTITQTFDHSDFTEERKPIGFFNL